MDDEEEEFKKLLKKHLDIVGRYPRPLKTATRSEFVTGLRKIRKQISPVFFWIFMIVYCLLFWVGIAWLISRAF